MKEVWLRRVQTVVAAAVLAVVCTLTFMSWSSTRALHYTLSGNWTAGDGATAMQLMCRGGATRQQCVCDVVLPSHGEAYPATALASTLYDGSVLVRLEAADKAEMTMVLSGQNVLRVRSPGSVVRSGVWLPMTLLHRAASGGAQDVWTALKTKSVYLAGLFAIMLAYRSLQMTLLAPPPTRRQLPRTLLRKKME